MNALFLGRESAARYRRSARHERHGRAARRIKLATSDASAFQAARVGSKFHRLLGRVGFRSVVWQSLCMSGSEPHIDRCSRGLQPNPSLHPTCYGWLRQPTQAGELKR
jgi:hypothetical protein